LCWWKWRGQGEEVQEELEVTAPDLYFALVDLDLDSPWGTWCCSRKCWWNCWNIHKEGELLEDLEVTLLDLNPPRGTRSDLPGWCWEKENVMVALLYPLPLNHRWWEGWEG